MARPTPSLRSIRTGRDARRVFAAQPSARVITAAVAVPVLTRLARRRIGVRDVVAATCVVAARGMHEWVIHRGLLHGAPREVRGRTVDLGAGHRAHHDDPDVLADALLSRDYAALYAVSVAAWVALLCVPFRRRLGVNGVLSAVAAAEGCLFAYEWRHFVDHTSVPLRTAGARRLRAHHRRHHHLDDTRSFGITATVGDRVHDRVGALSAARR